MGLYERELKELTNAGVKYVVVGAVALALHNHPRFTIDLDILPDLSESNLGQLIKVMTKLGYISRIPVDVNELKDPKKREVWYTEKNMKVFTFIHPKQHKDSVDVMIYPAVSFEEADSKKIYGDIEGIKVPVASLVDLLTLKNSAKRAKDLPDILTLERLLGGQI